MEKIIHSEEILSAVVVVLSLCTFFAEILIALALVKILYNLFADNHVFRTDMWRTGRLIGAWIVLLFLRGIVKYAFPDQFQPPSFELNPQ